MTETLNHAPEQEYLPVGNEYFLHQLNQTYSESFVPTLANLEHANEWVKLMPRDAGGNIVNDDGRPVPRELQDEVEEKVSEDQWRMEDDDFESKKLIANATDESRLDKDQSEQFTTFHNAAEADGLPSDFSEFKRYAADRVNLETEFRARDEERKEAQEAAEAARPIPGKIGSVKTANKLLGTDTRAQDSEKKPPAKSRRTVPEGNKDDQVIVPASKTHKATKKPKDQPVAPQSTEFNNLEELEALASFSVDPKTGQQKPDKILARNLKEAAIIRELERKYAGPGKSISQLAKEGWKWQEDTEATSRDLRAWGGLRYNVVGDPTSGRLNDHDYYQRLHSKLQTNGVKVHSIADLPEKGLKQRGREAGKSVWSGTRATGRAALLASGYVAEKGFRADKRAIKLGRIAAKGTIRVPGDVYAAGAARLIDRKARREAEAEAAYQGFWAVTSEPAKLAEAARQAAIANEEQRQVRDGERVGRFEVGTNGEAQYHSEAVK